MDTLGRFTRNSTADVRLSRFLTIASNSRGIELLPGSAMLCTLTCSAVTPDGQTVASNFIQHFVAEEKLPEREERGPTLILRQTRRCLADCLVERRRKYASRRSAHRKLLRLWRGVFRMGLRRCGPRANRSRATGARALRSFLAARGYAQTDSHRFPTQFELLVNDLPIHRALLPDHPHDTRGALSYLRGGRGAYGYLMRATIEDELLKHVADTVVKEGKLRLRCAVPENAQPHGGLTVYDYDCGRFPVGPTLVIEWEQA